MRKPETDKVVAENRRARHDYVLEAEWEAGIVLQGTEVKSLRAGRASLVDGFVDIEGREAWLYGVHIPAYAQGDEDARRSSSPWPGAAGPGTSDRRWPSGRPSGRSSRQSDGGSRA
jgi:hypothetical protein